MKRAVVIIPYQEKLGNYNLSELDPEAGIIIPYQEKLGNYNAEYVEILEVWLYHTKKN